MREKGSAQGGASDGSGGPASDFVGKRWHDMGGDLAALRAAQGGPEIDRGEHDFALWEKRVDALVMIAGAKGLFSVDGLRRALEDMGPEAFETQSYYDRWVQSLAANLIERGVVTIDELRHRMADVQARGATYGEAAGAAENST